MMRQCLGESQVRQGVTKIDEIIDYKVKTIVMRGKICLMKKMKYCIALPGRCFALCTLVWY